MLASSVVLFTTCESFFSFGKLTSFLCKLNFHFLTALSSHLIIAMEILESGDFSVAKPGRIASGWK
jgi:hypothetical protein